MAADNPLKAYVLVVDDHPAVRQGLELLLDSIGLIVAGEAGSRSQALESLKSNRFDLAVLDLALEDGSGIDLLGDLSERGIPALVYSMHEDPGTIARALGCGARGYVTKREEPDMLLEGVETVLRGGRFVSPTSSKSLAENNGEGKADLLFLLSERERDIFTALGRGLSNPEIAEKLNISPRTVETYFSRIVNKLGIDNVPALRKLAISARQTP